MSLRLHPGIRKNGGVRIHQPVPLKLLTGLPSASQLQSIRDGKPFNRFWMCGRSVRMAEALRAACPSDTTAHQVACQLLIMLQHGVIESAQEERSVAEYGAR